MSGSDPLGRKATSPLQLRSAAWWQIAKRVWQESSADNVGLISAGVAFYGFLSLVPALGALVLTYGLFASPETLLKTVVAISKSLPVEAANLITAQLEGLVSSPDRQKGWGLIVALALAIFGATKGVDALVTAITIAYGETETRGFVKRTATVVWLTVFSVIFTIVALTVIGALSLPGSLVPTVPFDFRWLIALGSTLVLILASALGAAIFFRYAPDRRAARWTWLTPGAVFTGFGWFVVTSGFALYASRFSDYGATWGSLAGIVVLLTWLYLSAFTLLIGAELNAEIEHQTAQDTTIGKDRPLGERDAVVADTVAGVA